MKARRLAVLALALVTVVTMGIGYAALTDALGVSGTGTLSKTAADEAFNGEVYFTGTPTGVNCDVVLDAPGVDDAAGQPDTATITIEDTLAIVGDVATATLTIQNDSVVPVTIVTNTSVDSDHFRVTCDYPTGNSIPAGDTMEITVKITLKQTVAADFAAPESFSITFNASSAG